MVVVAVALMAACWSCSMDPTVVMAAVMKRRDALDHPYDDARSSSNELNLTATEAATTSNPLPDSDESSAPCCPICLDEFQKGDRISCSFNRRCHHKFHHNCILDWLVNDDTCPCCRQSFLEFFDDAQANDDTKTMDAAAAVVGEGSQIQSSATSAITEPARMVTE